MKTLITLFLFFASFTSFGQINAKLMRYVDVSETQITFVYGGDIWIMPKEGGLAVQITHSPGEESYPKFSPNGSEIAYTASYNGNLNIFTLPVTGGIPKRLTYASSRDRMLDWHPDGDRILFASRRETGIPRVNQFFLVSKLGGIPTRLEVPYGELASFSPDGNKLAYITKITENYPFKRYRGGLASDILIFDLKNNKVVNITNNTANDGKPSWAGNKVYFLSDQDAMMRRNIWVYNTNSKISKPITEFTDFDITYMSAHKNALVFETGGELYLMNLETETYKKVAVHIISDLSVEIPQLKKVGNAIENMTLAPGGNRIVFEARGELFNVPSKDGFVVNLTQSSGAFDRNPTWSPDGNYIAFWSDNSGENEIYLQPMRNNSNPIKLSDINEGFGYHLYWSPDSKKIAFIDEKNEIKIIDIKTKNLKKVDEASYNIGHRRRFYFTINWSPDSKWIAYSKTKDNQNNALFMYGLKKAKVHEVTSGYYSDYNPVFSKDGSYLFYYTDRTFNAAYSGLDDGTWIYPNNTQLAAISLTKDVPYLLSPKNDVLDSMKEKDANTDEKIKKDKKTAPVPQVLVQIDWDDLESRIALLPAKPGRFGTLMSFKNKVVYQRFPNTGSSDGKPMLQLFDLKKRKEENIIDKLQKVTQSTDGKMLLVKSDGKYGVIKPEADQKIKDPVPTKDLVMQWNPREEWEQIFNDTWRRYRDFFYDKDMQQVDWAGLKIRYGALLKDARTRWDISNIQSNLLAELSAGHTYTRGGDHEDVNWIPTGYLGIDWELHDQKYRIKRIVRPAPWDTEVRSPFDRPGIKINTGDFILSVNGISLDSTKDPFAAFSGLSDKTVNLRVSKTGFLKDAKNYVIKCLTPRKEHTLRYHEWLDANRKRVDKLSDGKLGYVYMSNTSRQGQLELVKMYYGQLDKEGFIIDERFNGGGQLADRFLELLKRPIIYNLYWRHGKHITHPIKTNTGPMGMLINGWAGSGGDGLPWAFRELNAGPIVGERTLGILVGPATGHQLIDGGGITVPGARLYLNDGTWFDEGVGVKPDFPVWDDPNILLQGRDPQMEKVVKEVLKLLKSNPIQPALPPAMEDRTAKGLQRN